MNNQANAPIVQKQTTPKTTVRSSFLSLIKLVSDESLTRCMNRLVREENYELAIMYRDELVRRRNRI